MDVCFLQGKQISTEGVGMNTAAPTYFQPCPPPSNPPWPKPLPYLTIEIQIIIDGFYVITTFFLPQAQYTYKYNIFSRPSPRESISQTVL